MRKTLLLCVMGLGFLLQANAQNPVFEEYRKAAGDNAALYSGRIEERYHHQQYYNHPYWDTDQFRTGTVCFDGHLYIDQQLRYDTYRKVLLVVMPEKRNVLQVNPNRMTYFTIGGQKYVPYRDTYAALLYESPRIRLLYYIKCMHSRPISKDGIVYNNFAQDKYFCLQMDGKEYQLTSRNDLLKLFPEQKKALKAHARKHHLKYRERPVETMQQLAEQADILINK